jgi:hypothetical protein
MGKYNKNGENNPFYGKHHTEQTKELKSSKTFRDKTYKYQKSKIEDKEYESLAQASIEIGIKYTTLWHRIKSKNKKYTNYQYI